jgi:seryl-tRNA synthetase
MIDIKILRTNPEILRESIAKRNLKIDLDEVIRLDTERLDIQQELETLQALRNKTSKEIPTITDPSEKQARIHEMKEV